MYTLPHGDADDRGTTRVFTVASAPSETLVRLTTRLADQPSSFKHALAELSPGALLEVSGPHGQLVYDGSEDASVFIAGGIGITPFRAMLADLAATGARPNITLLYSNSTPDIPFRAFLDGLAFAWQRFRVVYTVTGASAAWHGPRQRIGVHFLQQHARPTTRQVYYVCGPTPFVTSVRDALAELGVPGSQIRHEGFPGYEQTAAQDREAIRTLPSRACSASTHSSSTAGPGFVG